MVFQNLLKSVERSPTKDASTFHARLQRYGYMVNNSFWLELGISLPGVGQRLHEIFRAYVDRF